MGKMKIALFALIGLLVAVGYLCCAIAIGWLVRENRRLRREVRTVTVAAQASTMRATE